jgi:hypothetical protein
MADPVTMAVVGGSVGAMMNKKDPLKGALLGAAGGYGGATLMGAGGLAGAGSSGVLPSALSGSTTINAAAPMAGQAFTAGPSAAMNAANLTTGLSGGSGVEAAKMGLFSGGMSSPAPFVSSGTSTGMIPSSLYEPTMMDRFASVGQYAQQNPVLTQMAMQSAQQAMQQPEAQFAPAGQVRSGQIQGGDYMSLLNPQQGTVLRPQPISLLG